MAWSSVIPFSLLKSGISNALFCKFAQKVNPLNLSSWI
jgi:hypothetical protein